LRESSLTRNTILISPSWPFLLKFLLLQKALLLGRRYMKETSAGNVMGKKDEGTAIPEWKMDGDSR
jgi:hypothetical protein